ncbi:MAG: ribosome biogenesis GTPase Der [Planctomycetes bacterium]|nr:ribosome biogenesis GTPase Der [Planctomycetota bacterium]
MSQSARPPADTYLRRIAIVGRPNVGKSTLLNRLVGSRVSIVEPTAGVTRDRIAVPGRISTSDGDRWFEFVDTGGIGIVDRDDLGAEVERQVLAAVHSSDLILLLVDVKDGITPLDAEVARRLRGVVPPVLLCVNKCEGRGAAWGIDEFRALGIAHGPIGISAQNGEGLRDLYDTIGALLPAPEEPALEEPPTPYMKLAVVGCRNAGKSTLVNALCREERMITSEIPGTTRDSVDVRFERDGKTFVVIDTAGVRKKQKMADAIEFFSDARSHRTVRRADVVLHLFDVSQELSQLDKALTRYVIDHYKPVILCGNKWDLVSDMERQEFVDYIRDELPQLSWAPIRFLSARDGSGVEPVLALAEKLYQKSHVKISTGALNKALKKANEERSPTRTGANVRLYYATQTTTAPPTFTVFVNDKRFLNKHYVRYLSNRLREELELGELPIRLELRDKQEEREDA